MVEWARVLAADGFHVLRFDYRGYGDSDGEFEDHTIEDHLADTARALSEVEERSNLECGLLCGLRLGATLAAITACRNNRNPSLVLWEPVISGSEYVSEMLKASAFVTRGAQTADELENDIEKGKEVVVRGHILTKGMLRSLKAVNLLESPLPGSGPVMLAYFCSGSQNTPPALLELHRKYAAGGDINLKPIRGRAPWASGRDYCVKPPEVFGTTRDWLARHSISTCAHATQAARKKIAQATSTPEVEKPVEFLVQDTPVRGILHLPPKVDAGKPAIVMLPQANVCRTASGRLYVCLARHLARSGWTVLRFDPRGVGDSLGVLPYAAMSEMYLAIQQGKFVADALAAIEFADKVLGCHSAILAGHCGGAATAALAAPNDRRVAGLLLMELHLHLAGEWKQRVQERPPASSHPPLNMMGYYRRKLVSLKAWRRFFAAKSNYRAIVRSLAGAVANRDRHDGASRHLQPILDLLGPTANVALLSSLLRCAQGGMPTLLVFGETRDAQDYASIKPVLHDAAKENPACLSEEVVSGADHLFSRREYSGRLIDAIGVWLNASPWCETSASVTMHGILRR